MDVNYRWSFLVDNEPSIERRQRFIPPQTYTVVDEDDRTKNLRDEEIALVKAVCMYEIVILLRVSYCEFVFSLH